MHSTVSCKCQLPKKAACETLPTITGIQRWLATHALGCSAAHVGASHHGQGGHSVRTACTQRAHSAPKHLSAQHERLQDLVQPVDDHHPLLHLQPVHIRARLPGQQSTGRRCSAHQWFARSREGPPLCLHRQPEHTSAAAAARGMPPPVWTRWPPQTTLQTSSCRRRPPAAAG